MINRNVQFFRCRLRWFHRRPFRHARNFRSNQEWYDTFFSHYLLLLFGVKLWYRLDRHSVTVRKTWIWRSCSRDLYRNFPLTRSRLFPTSFFPNKGFCRFPPSPFRRGDSQNSIFWGLVFSFYSFPPGFFPFWLSYLSGFRSRDF
jgi:hypothetical protein